MWSRWLGLAADGCGDSSHECRIDRVGEGHERGDDHDEEALDIKAVALP
jgi:hypothetical protein